MFGPAYYVELNTCAKERKHQYKRATSSKSKPRTVAVGVHEEVKFDVWPVCNICAVQVQHRSQLCGAI